MKVFIDDLRKLPDDFDLLFRSGEDFIHYLIKNPNQHFELISFDHDLGEFNINGYELIKELVNNNEIKFTFDKIQFHTSNIIGFENMWHYLYNAQIYNAFPKGIIDKNLKRYTDY